MDYEIKTVYQPEDLNGLYNAFLLGKKQMKISKKILNVISTVIAIFFMGLAALFLIGAIVGSFENHSIQIFFTSLPITLIFVLLGLWMYSLGHRRFRTRHAWKSYPYKNVEIVHCFYPEKYTVSQPASDTTNAYSLITRLFEDEERFYLFTSPQTAHILPKRNFSGNVDLFRDYIVKATGLIMEHA